MSGKTHELKIYANHRHAHYPHGTMILHLWFVGKHFMEMDLDIALNRRDVSYVDVIDLEKHTTKRKYATVKA